MISQEEVYKAVSEAEISLNQCYDYLLNIKFGSGDIADSILKFQPLLAECLYALMVFYKKLMDEKRQLIASKNSYEKSDFNEAMSQNSSYIEVIRKTIEIGKSLGDAYAWFFYRDNFDELGKHFEHKGTGLFVAGIGGRGEIEFIKNNQNFNGLFALYHSITSMLRVGDFSLYAIDSGVVGVGELKTEQEGKKLKVTAYVSSNINFNKISHKSKTATPNARAIEMSTENPQNNPRLTRQLLNQDRLLEKSQVSRTAKQYTKYEYGLINQLVHGKSTVLNEDKTLLLLLVKSSAGNLYEALLSKEDYLLPDNFADTVSMIITPDCDNNQAIIGNIDTSMSYSRIPIFWWEIDADVCRDIYFKKVSVATVFNPARLIQHYIDMGFTLDKADDIRKIQLCKIEDGKQIGLGNFELYFDLISHSLMKTQYVTDMIDEMIRSIENGDFEPNTKIEVKIQLHTFGGDCK